MVKDLTISQKKKLTNKVFNLLDKSRLNVSEANKILSKLKQKSRYEVKRKK